MSNTNVPVPKREKALPEWYFDKKGNHKGFRGGRWNMKRVAEFLVDNPNWQTIDDLARVVYGTVKKTDRENVRKHIPAQRNFMLNSLEKPIVTQYGERGRIARVKLYNKTSENDRVMLKMELDRARDRKEMSEKRYDDLVRVFLLANGNKEPPTAK